MRRYWTPTHTAPIGLAESASAFTEGVLFMFSVICVV